MEVDLDSSLVQEFIQNKAGPKAYSIIKSLNEGKTDEEIKEKVEIDDVNEIRSILNRLHYLGIIEYDKEQAEESNWYTYTWFLREGRIKELLTRRYEEELEDLQREKDLEETHIFFTCDSECGRHPFEVAYEYDFQCPECGEEMEKSEEDGVEEIRGRINEIKSFLEE